MSKLPSLILAGAALVAAAGCSSAASSSSAPAAAAPSSSGAPATALAPLTLGHFPSSTDGELAKSICTSWSGLRQQYVDKLAAGTPAFDLNKWFSSPAWATIQSDAGTLGNDPAFSNLETSLGLVITGDGASTANAAALDRACEHAD